MRRADAGGTNAPLPAVQPIDLDLEAEVTMEPIDEDFIIKTDEELLARDVSCTPVRSRS
jgi:hypothetical protein